MKSNRLIDVTKKNMKRNRFLAISTVIVTTIVLLISSFFITVAVISKKGVDHFEKRANVMIFFKRDTNESDILSLKERLEESGLVENIRHITKEEALSIYKEDFADNPELLSTVTADSLPPSLEIKAKSIDSLMKIIERINVEKETNAYIDDVIYFKDVVKNLKVISNVINVASIVMIAALTVMAFSLIRIAIGFNINAHREEIRVMELVGSPTDYITRPYILEGCAYGAIGGFLAATLIIVPFYIFISTIMKDAGFALSINQTLRDLDILFVKPVNITFLLAYYVVHIGVGALLGAISSFSAVKKYLD